MVIALCLSVVAAQTSSPSIMKKMSDTVSDQVTLSRVIMLSGSQSHVKVSALFYELPSYLEEFQCFFSHPVQELLDMIYASRTSMLSIGALEVQKKLHKAVDDHVSLSLLQFPSIGFAGGFDMSDSQLEVRLEQTSNSNNDINTVKIASSSPPANTNSKPSNCLFLPTPSLADVPTMLKPQGVGDDGRRDGTVRGDREPSSEAALSVYPAGAGGDSRKHGLGCSGPIPELHG
jgi:hypothetical protein